MFRPLLLGGPPPRTPPRRAAVAIMCDSYEPAMSNVSAPVFLEELDRSGGNAPMALLQAWWRRTFPADGHLSEEELVRGSLEREAPSDVDAQVFLEELGSPVMEGHPNQADGSVAAALLRSWWRARVPDPEGWWAQSVLDSGEPFWWRESETADGGMEVRLSDPRAAGSEANGEAAGGGEGGGEGGEEGGGGTWSSGKLESGAPFWWRECDEEPDGIDVRLYDPTCDPTTGTAGGAAGEAEGGA